MQRYFNPTTQVIFGSDEAQAEPIRAATDAEIPDLIAAGATVDASADYTAGNAAADQADASAPGSDAAPTAAGTPDSPNGTASDAGDQSKPDVTPSAQDAAEPSGPAGNSLLGSGQPEALVLPQHYEANVDQGGTRTSGQNYNAVTDTGLGLPADNRHATSFELAAQGRFQEHDGSVQPSASGITSDVVDPARDQEIAPPLLAGADTYTILQHALLHLRNLEQKIANGIHVMATEVRSICVTLERHADEVKLDDEPATPVGEPVPATVAPEAAE
jgi:hypothetical protein